MPKKIRKKILVVDDSPVMQEMTKKVLERSGCDIIAAYDGKECLRAVKGVRPDVILMDVILPDSDGKDLVRQIEGDPVTADIPIVFITNTVSLKEDKGEEIIEVNGKAYRAFAKPLHYAKILSVIRKEINRQVHGGHLPQGVLKKIIGLF